MEKDEKKQLTKENERWDDLMRCGYQIIQNPDYFCFGMDAVLLSGFARVSEGETVLDLGTGNGIIPILLAAKTEGKQFIGLEIQKALLDMAKRSVIFNKLENRVSFVCGDIKEISNSFSPAKFDVVTTNPPYMMAEHGIKNENPSISIARHEIKCNLEDIIRASSYALKPKGRLYMVHRPFRLVEIFATMQKFQIEPKKMRLIYPYKDKEPNMVLIEGIKGAKSRISVESPLIVYEEKKKYTKEIIDIYGF